MIRVVAPEPVMTLAEAKDHLRVDHDADDAKITAYMLAATAHLDGPEGRLRKAIMPQTWETAFDAFPESGIAIPLGPLLSVVSVTYTDGSGVEQTVDAADYEIDTYSIDGWVVPTSAWPVALETINAVKVRWIAGMSADSPPVCPPDILHAIKLKLSEFYDGTDVQRAVDSLIHIHKRIVLA